MSNEQDDIRFEIPNFDANDLDPDPDGDPDEMIHIAGGLFVTRELAKKIKEYADKKRERGDL